MIFGADDGSCRLGGNEALKKTILILLVCVMAALLCACGDVTVNIDGVAKDGAPPIDESVTYSFSVTYTGRDGSVSGEKAAGSYASGTPLSVSAEPADGQAFYCWTLGGMLEDGGTVVSYAKDYRFYLLEDAHLYANFRERTSVLVRYHANGGEALIPSDATPEAMQCAARETEDGEVYWDDFSLDYFLYPNTPGNMGYFTREGYTLVGYNTEPDNSGEFYNVGGKAFEDTDHVIELWCIWSEQSPSEDFEFTYSSLYNGWMVAAYNGEDENVSIPDTYENEPVVGVSNGAFAGNETVKSLVFPPCVKIIADGACSDMPNLWCLVIYDSLDYISDASFQNDYGLYAVFFSAATNPHYTNWFNNHAKKIELMNYWKDSERPLMIILGGSSTTYAVDAQQLESLLDRDYLVLNCGSNGANLFNMTSDWAMRFMDEGDFLLQIIEYSFWQMGGVQCTWETFRSFEGCYNVFSWSYAGKYSKLFDSFHDYLSHRRGEAETTYEAYVSNLAGTVGYYDNQGTLTVVTKPNGSDTFWKNRSIYFGDNFLYDFMIDYSNYQYQRLADLGIDCAMAFTPLNRNSLYSYQTDEAMEDFERYLHENLNVAIISDLQENILDPAIFFDDDYHLAAPARAEYTERLAADLNEYFASADAAAAEPAA